MNSLGTMSLGVFTPTRASTPQKRRMVKMMAKSLISFLTWREEKNRRFDAWVKKTEIEPLFTFHRSTVTEIKAGLAQR